jgi:hypothetical protein
MALRAFCLFALEVFALIHAFQLVGALHTLRLHSCRGTFSALGPYLKMCVRYPGERIEAFDPSRHADPGV